MAIRIDAPSPPGAIDWEGGGSDWVELATARGDIQANLLVGRLELAGIATYTVKDRKVSGAWLLAGSNPWAPVKIFVRKLQLEDARLVFAEIAFDAPDTQLVTSSTSSGQRLAPVWWATAVVLGATIAAIALLQYR